ncbi:MAG: TIGR02597 family protein, partial [Limisphaerales bacterium]
TNPPASQTVNQGQNATFNVSAIGNGTLSYQWKFNNGAISGANSSSYTVLGATNGNAGSYTVVVSNGSGNTTSSAAILTVIIPPSVTGQPASTTVNQGQNAIFTSTASGTVPLSYQWRFNNGNISGANSSSYTKTSAQPVDAGSYSVVVTNAAGTATSSGAVLTVIVPPSITSQPASVAVLEGSTATFNVTETGTRPSYQGRFNGTPIANATAASYQKAAVQMGDAGSYSVIVSNSAGTATSSDAVLTVVSTVTALTSIAANADNTVSMVWQVTANTNYTLQYKTNLLDAQWNNINNFAPSGSTLTVSDGPVADVQRSYQLASAQTVSEIGGLLRLTLLGNSDNIVSIPFGRAPAISLLVGSTAANVITVSSSPGWTANQFVYSSGTQSNSYFVRFTSGAAAGRIYPITANGGNTLTVNLGNDSLAAVVQNDAFSIEAYWTLDTVFPNGTGVNVSPTIGNRNTEVLIPDLTSAGINLSASKVYFFNGGVWKQVGQGSTSHNDDILQPNAYLIVRHNVATNTVLNSAGRVISSPITTTLLTKAGTSQDNYIGLQRPVSVSLNDSGLISSGAFAASPLPGSRTDELLTFDNSVVARNKSSSASYYYWNGAWRQVGAGGADVGTDLVFQPGTGIMIRKGTNSVSPVWTNSATWTQ